MPIFIQKNWGLLMGIVSSSLRFKVGIESYRYRLAALVMISALATSCGPKAFTKGDYDDPTRVELLDDKFNEADMQQMAETIVKAMVSCAHISNAKMPPVVIVERVINRTQEHIDTVALTEMISTNLLNSGKVRFVNKSERDILQEEIKYNEESGNVSGPTQKKKGKETGADFMMSGSMMTNIQEVGEDKLIYYKLNMKLTNYETKEINCAQEREIRKKFKKKRI
jgi:penicillin-binding protein activator